MAIKKNFRMNGMPTKNLAYWLKDQFPNLIEYSDERRQYRKLANRIHEVHEAAITVLELTIKRGDARVKTYYEDDLERLKLSYNARDFVKYTEDLATLLKAIEEEGR